MNRLGRGGAGRRFGPCCCLLLVTSSVVRPLVELAKSSRTFSAGNACQVGRLTSLTVLFSVEFIYLIPLLEPLMSFRDILNTFLYSWGLWQRVDWFYRQLYIRLITLYRALEHSMHSGIAAEVSCKSGAKNCPFCWTFNIDLYFISSWLLFFVASCSSCRRLATIPGREVFLASMQ